MAESFFVNCEAVAPISPSIFQSTETTLGIQSQLPDVQHAVTPEVWKKLLETRPSQIPVLWSLRGPVAIYTPGISDLRVMSSKILAWSVACFQPL